MPVKEAYKFDPSLNILECPSCHARFVITNAPPGSFEEKKCYCPACGYSRCFDKVRIE